MSKLHKIISEIYPVTLRFSSDVTKICKLFKIEPENTDDGGYGGLTVSGIIDGCLVVAIYMDTDENGNVNLANLAHEVYHAVTHICNHCNLRPTYSNDEQGAYLTTWIYQWCIDKIKEDKLKPLEA